MNQHGADPSAGPFPEVTGLRLLQELGRSPKGVTYKARRLVEQDVVAAKVLRSSRCEKRFISELPRKAESSFILEHKGLVRSLGCVEEKGRLILLMDYAQGEPLAKLLQSGQPLALPRALLLGLQCANALRYAALHQLHHGRLHPSDLILGEDHARITGVGLGNRPEHAAWAEPEAPPFEPLIYTAPEAMPSRPFPESPAAQSAVDVYSLGAVLFHILTGTAPFRGADEAALENERKFIGAPVLWPPDKKAGLPAGLIALLERTLAPEAKDRPGYDELSSKLSAALGTAEKAEAAWQRQPTGAAENRRSAVVSGARSVAGSMPTRVSGAPHAASANGAASDVTPPWGYALPQSAKPSLGTRIYNVVLLGLTAMVFIIAVVLALYIFVLEPLRQAPVAANPAQPDRSLGDSLKPTGGTPVLHGAGETPAAQTKAGETPVAKVNAVETPPPHPAARPVTELERKAAEYAAATTQLEVIQGMLTRKEVQPSAALLKVTREEIVDKAGRETPTGVKALVLAKEIEEALGRPAAAQGAEPQPKAEAQPVKSSAGVPAGETAAVGGATTPPVIPGVGRAGTAPAGQPPPAPTETPAAQAKTNETPPANVPASHPPAAVTPAKPNHLNPLLAKARAFQYTELAAELPKASTGLAGEEKSALEVYALLAKREQELFNRCRKWLVDEIQRRPKHDSPLQVFPRKNEPGDDIVEFDEAGLKISEKRPAGTSQRTLAWEKTPAAQAFALMQLTSDKNSVEDQLGLAVFAFSRGLKAEVEAELSAARAIPGGREKADTVKGQIEQVSKYLEGGAETGKGTGGAKTGTK